MNQKNQKTWETQNLSYRLEQVCSLKRTAALRYACLHSGTQIGHCQIAIKAHAGLWPGYQMSSCSSLACSLLDSRIRCGLVTSPLENFGLKLSYSGLHARALCSPAAVTVVRGLRRKQTHYELESANLQQQTLHLAQLKGVAHISPRN